VGATAERRNIRRAFGEQALGTITSHAEAIADLQRRHVDLAHAFAKDSAELHAAVEAQAQYAARLDEELGIATGDIGRLKAWREAADKDFDVINRQHHAFVGRTFLQRLRWLVTGR
jgi:hypothetical protein